MLNGPGFFITGTDTDVGKTWSSVALMRHLQQQGRRVAGMKPVAAGCEWLDGGWRNGDALLLQQYSSVPYDYRLINPYLFQQAVSPHIACQGQQVDFGVIKKACRRLGENVDTLLIEGAGGWFSPLDQRINNADLALALQLPVIMVVGLRLGCINHALLTARAIVRTELKLTGWIAVRLQPEMSGEQENIAYLQASIDAALLAVLPYRRQADFDQLAKSFVTNAGGV